MFAGGGAIPLEAARLGCESHAIDYNPVAHLIELCTLVYPQTFGASLADDFQRWSAVILDRMRDEIGDLYPPIEISTDRRGRPPGPALRQRPPQHLAPAPTLSPTSGRVPSRAAARAARRPCPLVRQSWLRRKGGAIAAVPRIEDGDRLRWDIVSGSSAKAVSQQTEQTGSGQAVCVACNTPATADYVKEMAVAGRMGESLSCGRGGACRQEAEGQEATARSTYPPEAAPAPAQNDVERRLPHLRRNSDSHVPKRSCRENCATSCRPTALRPTGSCLHPRQLLVLFTSSSRFAVRMARWLPKACRRDRARALATYFGMAFGRLVQALHQFGTVALHDRIKRRIGSHWRSQQALKMVYDFLRDQSTRRLLQDACRFALENRGVLHSRTCKGSSSPAVVARGNAEKLFYDDETFDAVVTDPPYYTASTTPISRRSSTSG